MFDRKQVIIDNQDKPVEELAEIACCTVTHVYRLKKSLGLNKKREQVIMDNQDKSVEELAEMAQCTITNVYRLKRSLGLNKKRECSEKLLRNFTLSNKDIAKLTGYSTSTIRDMRHKLGVSCGRKRHKKKQT